MATMTGMDPEAADAESERSPDPVQHAAAALDAELLARLVAQAVAAQSRPRRSALLIALATTIAAGLIAVAAAGYTALRADITALHAEINNVETRLRAEINDLETVLRAEINGVEERLRAEINSVETGLRAEIQDLREEIREFRAEVNSTLLDHTERLARLETVSQLSPPAQ